MSPQLQKNNLWRHSKAHGDDAAAKSAGHHKMFPVFHHMAIRITVAKA